MSEELKPEADDGEVMRIWRECGLPEYFLGNGGTNHKLVAFAKACALLSSPRVEEERKMREALERIHEIARADNKHDIDNISKGDFADDMDAIFDIALSALSLQVE